MAGWAVCLFRLVSLLVCYAIVRHPLFLLLLYPWNARLWLKHRALGTAAALWAGNSVCRCPGWRCCCWSGLRLAELVALLSPRPARGSLAVCWGPSGVQPCSVCLGGAAFKLHSPELRLLSTYTFCSYCSTANALLAICQTKLATC